MNQSGKKNGWNAGGGRLQLIAYLRYYAVAVQTDKDNTFLHLEILIQSLFRVMEGNQHLFFRIQN